MAKSKTPAASKRSKGSATPPRAEARATPSISPLRGMAVDEWVKKKAGGWHGQVVEQLIALVRKAAPDATASIKWAQPVFEVGGPFAFIKVAKAHVTFGFWRGAELKDPNSVLEGGAVMRHMKIASTEDVDEKVIASFVRQAVALNHAKGDPTARRRSEK